MALSSHLQELRRKHQMLDSEVEHAQRSAGVDSLEVVALKKEKLRLKEEIERLQG